MANVISIVIVVIMDIAISIINVIKNAQKILIAANMKAVVNLLALIIQNFIYVRSIKEFAHQPLSMRDVLQVLNVEVVKKEVTISVHFYLEVNFLAMKTLSRVKEHAQHLIQLPVMPKNFVILRDSAPIPV
mgnify:CR=1 FL=1